MYSGKQWTWGLLGCVELGMEGAFSDSFRSESIKLS